MKKLGKKTIHIAASRGKRWLYYAIACLGASLLVLAGNLLDESLGTKLIGPGVRLVLAWTAFSMARQSGLWSIKEEGALGSVWLIPAGIAFLLYLFFYGGLPGLKTGAEPILLAVIGALSAALWEEIFFRFWGSLVFEEADRYRVGDFLLLALLFGAMHLTGLIASPLPQVLIQVTFAVLSALFFQTLYHLSRSLRLVIGLHFLLNLTLLLSQLLVPAEGRFFPSLTAIAPLVIGANFALAAAVMARRHPVFKERGKGLLARLLKR